MRSKYGLITLTRVHVRNTNANDGDGVDGVDSGNGQGQQPLSVKGEHPPI